MAKYAYCTVCKEEIENPSRKPLTTFQKVLWVLLSIGTVGIGAIVYLIIAANKPKIYCPTCITKLTFSKEPLKTKKEEEEPKTPKEKILRKAEKEKEATKKKPKVKKKESIDGEDKKVDDTFCPFCGEDISSTETRCPYCGSKL